MKEEKKYKPNLGFILGILGLAAGIGLLFTKSWFIGLFGSIASASLVYKTYIDNKN